MKKKLIIIILLWFLLIVIPFFYQTTFSKYIFDYSFVTAKILIDKKPEITILSTSNTNIGYQKYANKTDEIAITVKVKEKNITINHFNSDYIKVFLNDETINCNITIDLISHNQSEYIYIIFLTNISGNGNLYVVFPEGIIQDNLGQNNTYQKFNTQILIDNIAPEFNCEEFFIENNKSNYNITSNERLRPINGWNISNSKTSLSKIFSTPVTYLLPITDYAGNVSEALVKIVQANNIILYYTQYNGYPMVKFQQSGEISGKQAIEENSSKKTEMMVLYLDGELDDSILQARIFDYTYWGENTKAICHTTELDYQYGYSPGSNTWYDTNGKNKIRFSEKISLFLGGNGHNAANNSCSGLFNPIPPKIADQNLYGISGISLKLKDITDYSIVYQIYVPNVGWLKASSDGEETTYSHDKPFSAIRINIVPKSEKHYLINYWNRDLYTNTID